ncbi:poly [ADP-ribose] polymerase tankyrase-1-like [Triticum urartu]|uniref:Serine/threonine-protein kinase BSK1-like TPR repeats domain-containing protein n=1 Tax=Triticum urartu TaxID=4572 RepID=A0A8R7VEW8_TRIUA|nr:poly [ADP-ribose] polymerase tankyrase-1-like [Triticum urartu]XP_048549050.1 poly [ADP-ribose] polymerase tankyrase-1-like [Triticum urartu]
MAPNPAAIALLAALDGNLRLLKKMSKKMDLRETKDPKGLNALHFAANKGSLEICKFLLEDVGVDVNSVSSVGATPMFYAALKGNLQVARYLLDHGSDPAKPSERGLTPLHNAAEHGHCEIVRLLLSKGVDVDVINYRGTPLHMTAAKGQHQAMKILLEHGADPNRVVNHIFSPLMMACCGNSLECMKLLIEAGADVNGNSSSGPTPLTGAVDDGSTEFAKFLLEAGADPNIPNQHGDIPIKRAAVRGQRELVELLFPKTNPIPSVPDWSVDGIITTMKSPQTRVQDRASAEERKADLKSQGKEAFAKKDYFTAMYYYGLVMEIDPLDATLFANRSLCWLRMREGDRALADAQRCKMLRPGWSKAWYREGSALSFMEDYQRAVDAFQEALRLDPDSSEIKKMLSEAKSKATR